MSSSFSPKKVSSYAYLLAPCALLALGAFARELPPPRALAPAVIEFRGAKAPDAAGVVSLEQTMIVQAKKSAGSALLTSRLAAAGVTARAPMAGQIARVLVREGEFVNVNDRILQISTRGATLVDRGAERRAARAETEQVAAARDQSALQSRMMSAHKRLENAQNRVARARERVLAAQRIVQKLKNGDLQESETRSAPMRPRVEEDTTSRREYSRAANATAEAQAKAEKSAAAASAAQSAAREALREAERAEKTAAQKSRRIEASAAAPDEKGSESEKTSVQPAQENTVDEAAGRAAVAARRKADRLQDEARAAERIAARDKSAARDAARIKNSIDVPLFGNASSETAPASTRGRENAPRETANISVSDAARLVREAQEESLAAIAEARRLKSEVELYDRQVSETQQRMNASGASMEAAQQRLMNTTIRARLSVVRAPTSGTVLWVAPLASEVQDGEPLVTVGSRNRLSVSFEDASGAWKNLREGDSLPALAYAKEGAPGVPVVVKVREIEAPQQEGLPATLSGSVVGAAASTRLAAGMRIVCSIDKPGEQSTIMVPSSAIRRGENGQEIAVLQPQSDDFEASVANDASTREAETEALYRVEWRRIVTGGGDGVRLMVRSGISSGERILLQPSLLNDATSQIVRLQQG